MRRRLPIRVESRCQEDWSAMRPSGEGRHCDRCDSTVVDLTRATRSQAEALIRARAGKVCGRVRRGERGEAVFAPEPIQAGLIPMAIAGLLAACAAPEPEPATPTPAAQEAGVSDASPLDLASADSTRFGGSIATGVMMPIGPDDPIGPPVVTPVVAAPVTTTPAAEEQDAEPTAEQRALTRRKHSRRQTLVQPPIQQRYDLGMMVMSDDF